MEVLRSMNAWVSAGEHVAAPAVDASGGRSPATAEPVVRKVDDPWMNAACGRPSTTASRPRRAAAVGSTVITALNANAKPETKARATLPNALYRLSYSLPGVGNGLTQLTFPMKIDAAQQRRGPNDAGHYYAMQFDVNDLKGRRAATGYIGLQPRQDGKALVAFSGFGKSFRAPSGIPSADGGPGASNATLIDFRFGHTYELTIERDAGDRRMLSAFVRDVTRAANPGAPRYVKSLRMDRDVLLAGRQTGFVEHYGKSLGRSSDIAYTAGTFHAPFGTSEQGKILHGSLTQGELHGRFQHSTLGHRSITTVGRRIVEVALGIRGAS